MGSTMAVKARFVKRTNRIRMTVGLFLLSLLLRKVQRVWDVKTVPKTTDCFSEQNYSQRKGVNRNIKLCSYIWEVVTCYDPGHRAPHLHVVTGNHRPRTSCSLPLNSCYCLPSSDKHSLLSVLTADTRHCHCHISSFWAHIHPLLTSDWSVCLNADLSLVKTMKGQGVISHQTDRDKKWNEN